MEVTCYASRKITLDLAQIILQHLFFFWQHRAVRVSKCVRLGDQYLRLKVHLIRTALCDEQIKIVSIDFQWAHNLIV